MIINKKDNIIWLLPCILIFVILLMVGMCTPRINEKYMVDTTKRETLEIFTKMKGKVEAKDFVSIGLDVQLQVDDVFFKEGARIKKGDILVKFSDYKERDLNSKMQELKQNLAVKNSQLRFLKNQYGEGADTTNDINNLTGEIKALEGELIKLNNESGLVRRAIISPIDGYIVKINALKGQYADSLTPVVVLTKIQDVKIVSEPVRENQLQYVNVGNTANISVINNNNSYEAILYKINNIGIENLKTLEFLTSDFKDLSLNQEVNIRLIHQKKENVITVPLNAVIKRKSKNGKIDKYYIYLIDKNNKVTEKEVLVGMNNGEKIEIFGENIKEGMEIVVNPNDKIKNNVIMKRIDYKQIKINKEKELEKLQRENEQKKKDIEKNEAEIIRLKRNEKK